MSSVATDSGRVIILQRESNKKSEISSQKNSKMTAPTENPTTESLHDDAVAEALDQIIAARLAGRSVDLSSYLPHYTELTQPLHALDKIHKEPTTNPAPVAERTG